MPPVPQAASLPSESASSSEKEIAIHKGDASFAGEMKPSEMRKSMLSELYLLQCTYDHSQGH